MAGLPVVFVHGGGHGAWCWAPMLDHLTSEAIAVDLPPKSVRGGPGRYERPPELRTLTVSDFAESVLADVDEAGYERFVLVGHSMAGLTIPEVARRAPERVAHLVFVSCTVPPEGGSIMDVLAGDVADTAATNVERARDDTDAGEDAQISAEQVVEMFCNDMDEEQTQFVLDHFGNEALPIVAEPVSRAGLSAEIPKTWVRLLKDAIMTVDLQDAQIANLAASPGGTVEVIDLDAAHNAMISRPRELAAIVDRIVAAAA
jgi:pimeloyl-ACP methyl ester carboxylesterase